MVKKILLGLLVLVLAVAGFFVYRIGPGNIIGMIQYDQREEGKLQPGDPAPDVSLVSLDGKDRIKLSSFIQAKPLVLVFGSFTWPPFRKSVDLLKRIHEKHGTRAEFLTIYIKEAHPQDEWQMKVNEKEDVCYMQPKTLSDRVTIANDFVKRCNFNIPLLVDPIENPANAAYAAWPERLYVIDERGIIVYKGKPGPFGYKPEEVQQWLDKRFSAAAATLAKRTKS